MLSQATTPDTSQRPASKNKITAAPARSGASQRPASKNKMTTASARSGAVLPPLRREEVGLAVLVDLSMVIDKLLGYPGARLVKLAKVPKDALQSGKAGNKGGKGR
jgi:hypothetical protein